MASLYPSWIELPVLDLDRATAFYRKIFDLIETPKYLEEPDQEIVVLLPSEKTTRAPGVSLVRSPLHTPGEGAIINFHLESHTVLDITVERIRSNGGDVRGPVRDMGDGVRYVNVRDSEGNPFALSSYEPLPDSVNA